MFSLWEILSSSDLNEAVLFFYFINYCIALFVGYKRMTSIHELLTPRLFVKIVIQIKYSVNFNKLNYDAIILCNENLLF